MKRLIVLLCAVTALNGCTSLQEVREYAGESAKFAGYKELTTHFRDTFAREAPYLSGNALDIAEANDRKRQEAYGDLIRVHDTLALYMMTLAKLAGETTFDLSQGIDATAGQIKAHPELGIDAAQVGAISNLTKLISKWALSAYQQDAVRDMINDGQAPLQTSLDGMRTLLRLYRKTHDNERKGVLGLFETEFALGKLQPKDPLLSALSRVHYQDKKAEYDAAERRFDTAEKGIERIAAGHTQLYRGVDRLSAREVKDALADVAKDIKALRKQLQALQ